MNLHHLAVFHAIAETGSISRAAARLHISQPAISRQLREFEHVLDTLLFDRLPRGMQLTEAGDELAGFARRIFALERQAEERLLALRDLQVGHLAVGASTTIGNYLLPSVLAEFAQRHPGVQVTLEVGNTEKIQQQLSEHQLDVGLTEGVGGTDEFHTRVCMADRLVVVAAPGLLAQPEQPYRIEALADAPWITREHGSGTRAVLEQALADRALELREVMALASTEAIKRAVAAGAGLSVVSALTVTNELASGELIILPVEGFPQPRPLHLLQRRHDRPSRSVAAFLELLAESVAPDAQSTAPSAFTDDTRRPPRAGA